VKILGSGTGSLSTLTLSVSISGISEKVVVEDLKFGEKVHRNTGSSRLVLGWPHECWLSAGLLICFREQSPLLLQ